MSENLFPSLDDGDKDNVDDTASNRLDVSSLAFKMQLIASVKPNISDEFSFDGSHNENGKRSLPSTNTTVYKKVCADIKGHETKSEFSDNIFESTMQLQIDCDTNKIESYPQDSNSYSKNTTGIDTSIYYPSSSFHVNEDVNLEVPISGISNMNVLNEFHQHRLTDSSCNQLKGPQNFNTTTINESEINAIIDGLDNEINDVLEETAERNKLTATNVKNILRHALSEKLTLKQLLKPKIETYETHVVTNEYVLAMVRNTMRFNGDEEGELEDAVYEPKLTRSKAKELRERQVTLPWPVSSEVKQDVQELTKKILEAEFPDDDNSSDEEYKPNEEECHSEEEASSLKGDSIRSPNSNNFFSSPDKIPIWDPPLVIAEPETVVESNKDDLIALRTRSKLPLVNTPLETIEASFIAPDITIDMYDTECDDEDWQNFLLEFTKPLDTKSSLDQPDDDDGDDDPEYNVLDEEDDGDDKQSIKISQKELNALMDIILESAEQKLDEVDEDEDNVHKDEIENVNTFQPETFVHFGQIFGQFFVNQTVQWFSESERLQLKEQMRMHVQLLTQSFLLSHGMKEVYEVNSTSATLLEEIGTFCTHENVIQKNSYFCADNLEEALTIVSAAKAEKCVLTTTPLKFRDKKRAVPSRAQTTIAHSKVFIYPHLLPVVGFRSSMQIKSKAIFTNAEDLLLALGLEQFSPLENCIHWIQALLLPIKTIMQLKRRIKICRLSKCSDNNAVKYYHLYGKAPAISQCVKPYDKENVEPPCELPVDVLPQWMLAFAVNQPVPAPDVQPKDDALKPRFARLPERRKYRRILPSISYVPLCRKVSPFLTKYNPQKHKATPKVSVIRNRSAMVPIKPKPTPLTNANLIPVTVAPCFVPMKSLTIDSTSIFVPPITTTIVSKRKPIFVTNASQIIQKPELSTLQTPIFMTAEIIPKVSDNSSQKLVEEMVVDSKTKNQEEIDNDEDGKTDCDTSIPETEQFESSSVRDSLSDLSEIDSVSSTSENDHDPEISLDLEVCEETDDEAFVDTAPHFELAFAVNQPFPAPDVQPKDDVLKPRFARLPERRKYRRILPSISYVPLCRKVSPFLTKYKPQKRKATPKVPVIRNRSAMVPIKPKPTPLTNANLIPVTVAPCFVSMKNLTIDSTSTFVPPITTTIVSKRKPIFVTNASQIIQKPELSTLQTPIFMTAEIIPKVSDNSSQKLVEEMVVDSKTKNQEEIDNDEDGKTDCDTSIPETEQFESSSVGDSLSDLSEIDSVSSTSENDHDPEISLDLEVYEETDDEAFDDTAPDFEVCEETDYEIVDDTPLHLEVCEEADDGVIQDKQNLAALITANSATICKNKNKHQQDLESTLQLLSPNVLKVNLKEPETIFVRTCLLRAIETLENEPLKRDKFLKTLCSFKSCSNPPLELFTEIREILKDHPALVDEFVGFLSSAQAKECGKFHEYVTISKVRAFFRRLEIYFNNQPDHLHRILQALGQLQNQKLTPVSVIDALRPLLQNHVHLLEEFLQILPYEPSPDSLADIKEEKIPNNSHGEIISGDSCNKIEIPDSKDLYKGKDCPCSCHSSTADIHIQNKSKHCTNCDTKDENKFKREKKSNIAIIPTEHSLTIAEESHTPTASVYPSEVIEDAVLPPVIHNGFSSIPSDFRGLQEPFSLSTKCQTSSSSKVQKDSSKKVAVSEDISGISSVNSDSESNLPSSKLHYESSSSSSSSNVFHSFTEKSSSSSHAVNWTRDQDKIILETYRAHGISKNSFILAADAIGTRTALQVKERFIEIIRRLEQHLKATKS